MPLPDGIEPVYVWCLLWFGLSCALAGVLTSQMSSVHLEDRVSSRTYRRLGRLNSYLNRLVEMAWNKTPTDDLVTDLAALVKLEAEVLRAAAVRHLLLRRGQLLDLGRTASLFEAAAALAFAGIAAATGLRAELVWAAVPAFLVGVTAALLALVGAGLMANQVEGGEDFL